jgi:peptidoglycan/LPS O-acetylase OafA/YrhL
VVFPDQLAPDPAKPMISVEAEKLRRDGWIDVFRGLAAAAVVLFHFSVIPFAGSPGPLTSRWREFWLHGYLGVAVFFAVSGYCIGRTWLRAAEWKEFAWRRFRRIYPPYWASLAVLIALACARRIFAGHNDVAIVPRAALGIAATFALATDPFSPVKTMNWVYWTLTCEVTFYVVMTVALLAPRYRVSSLAIAHSVFCLAAACNLAPATGPLFFINYWPLFGIGAALAVVAEHRLPASLMLAAAGVYAAFGRHVNPRSDFVVIAFVTVALIWLTRNVVFPRILSPIRGLGLISYSLYLVHIPVGIYCLMRLLPSRFPSDMAYFIEETLLFSGTVIAAWFFYIVAERPFARPRSRS